MASNLEELGLLLQEVELTMTDLSFILNYIKQENMSPQLVMRRIKAFENLREKLEDESDKMKIEQLESELTQVKTQLDENVAELDNLKNQKSGLESQKMELESKSELMDSEREELQRQLEMLRDLQMDDDDDVDTENTEGQFHSFIQQLEGLKSEDPNFETILEPIIEEIKAIIAGSGDFDTGGYRSRLSEIVTKSSTLSSSVPTKTEKNTEFESKTPSEEVSKKPEKKVSAKEEQVLTLFIDFVEEADDDKSFKDRVSTICDMDEAYQYLGSIGLSQVYSFASKGIEKKSELKELLISWRKDGIPK
ncbi:MAG: hypothetical protein ACXAE3_02920 [Candidatus Kariarchaeaceae archaeon]|jgi:uncharacterized protein YPO0396